MEMDLTGFFNNMLESIGSFLPGIFGALAVLIIGWLIASVFKGIVYRLLKKTTWDDKIFGGTDIQPEKFISKLVYYIIMVMVLMVVLEMLGVSQVLDPLEQMVEEFVTFLPNLVAALAIGFIGYVIAKVASELVNLAGNLLENLAAKLGFDGSEKLVNILKKVVFIIVFIPILIAALDALQIEAISEPATEMLSTILNVIPNLIACVLIISLFYFGGKYVVGLLKDLLISIGIDNTSSKIGLQNLVGNTPLSSIITNVLFAFIVFIGVITGVERLEFDRLTDILNNLLEWGGQIAMGLVILVIGNFLASFAHSTLSKTNANAFIANVVRYAILGMFLAISLRSMGIANEIVNLAFGLILGSLAVVVALAYGLGGREAAGKHMAEIIEKFKR